MMTMDLQPSDEEISPLVLRHKLGEYSKHYSQGWFFLVVFPSVPVTGPVRGRKQEPVWLFLYLCAWSSALSSKSTATLSGKRAYGWRHQGTYAETVSVQSASTTVPEQGNKWATSRNPQLSVCTHHLPNKKVSLHLKGAENPLPSSVM